MNTRLLKILSAGLLLASMGVWGEAAPSRRTRLETNAILENNDWLFVANLAYSPDGKILASCGSSPKKGTIRLWDVAKAKVAAELPDPCAEQLAFSPDGKTLASCWGRRIWLWDVAGRKRIAVVSEDASVTWMIFSSDGKEITACERLERGGGRLTTWNVEKQEKLRSREMVQCPYLVDGYPSVKKPLLIDRCDPDSFRAPLDDFPFMLREAITGEKVFVCKGHRIRMGGFAIDRAETVVASVPTFDSVKLWDRATGKNIAGFPIQGAGPLLSPDAMILAVIDRGLPLGRPDRSEPGIRLYEVPSGKLLDTVNINMPMRSRYAFSPDGRLLATTDGTTIKLWTVPAAWRKKTEREGASP